MIIGELMISPKVRLRKLLRILENAFSITIDFNSIVNENELKSIYDECEYLKKKIIIESIHNSYNQNPEYAKACLIQEAINIFLSEIAPKRRSRIKKSNA